VATEAEATLEVLPEAEVTSEVVTEEETSEEEDNKIFIIHNIIFLIEFSNY
jgi:hypothetical protein